MVELKEKEFDLMIYPNPFTKKIRIDLDQPMTQITIYNLKGQLIYSGMETLIDTSKWSVGLYMVLVRTQTKLYSQKIVKH